MGEDVSNTESPDDLDRFMRLAFDDLICLSKENPDVFEDLYYNRKDQCDDFASVMEDCAHTAINILVKGEAGVGKSNFIYKLVRNEATVDGMGIYPVIVDYRDIVPITIDGFIIDFLNKIEKYFVEIGHPIHTIDIRQGESLDKHIQKVYKHIDCLDKSEISKHLIIFLDDLDYSEGEWFKLLKYFLPFARSKKVSLVLSVRPTLYNSIHHYDDRFDQHYLRDAHRINLEPVSVERVISTRLAPVLIADEEKNTFHRFIDWLFSRQSSLCHLARGVGIKSLEDLPRFDYPITKKLNTFMQRITNGNLREIFDMAYVCLKYINDNKDKLEQRIENGTARYEIGRGSIIQLFSNDIESNFYRIIDINIQRSKKGNSLYYNVLEAVKCVGVVDDRFYNGLFKLGHKKQYIDHAIEFLSSKENRFFHPKKMVLQKRSRSIVLREEYVPTCKLEMYLQLGRDWEEYIDKFGAFGNSYEVEL